MATFRVWWTADLHIPHGSSHPHTERDLLAPHADSTCQLVFWDSRGLVCLFTSLSACVCVRTSIFPLYTPHLSACCSFLHSPIFPTSYRLSHQHPLDLTPCLCTCDWKTGLLSVRVPSFSLQPPGSYSITQKGRDKLQEYTCVWCECQSWSQWQPIPGQIMESANLSVRQISLTVLSPTPNFKESYKPHYQMRKAISKEDERNVDMATMAPLARD